MEEIVTCLCCGCTYDVEEEMGSMCPSCGRMFIDHFEPWGISTSASYRPATEEEKEHYYKNKEYCDRENARTIGASAGSYESDEYYESSEYDDYDRMNQLAFEAAAVQAADYGEDYEEYNETSRANEPIPAYSAPEAVDGRSSESFSIYTCKACHNTFEAAQRPSRCPLCGTKKINHRRAVRLASKKEREQYKNGDAQDASDDILKNLFGEHSMVRTIDYKNRGVFNQQSCTEEKCRKCTWAAICQVPVLGFNV